MNAAPVVLCWGRGDRDYSRNAIVRACLSELGFRVVDFRPASSLSATLEARFGVREAPALVWVPAFRQRDVAGAARFARRHDLPLLFDPLISAYDKQVEERARHAPGSPAARRLLEWERRRFALADVVLADTDAHAAYFHDVLGVSRSRLHVVPVGADERVFTPRPWQVHERPLELLFYGSFLALQGPRVIVEAARRLADRPFDWTLVGDGPQAADCRAAAAGLERVRFEPWVEYGELPARIGRADIALGIFGTTTKALRVVPNKVHQCMASARTVVTLASDAYPRELRDDPASGLHWVPAGDAAALADTIDELGRRRAELGELGRRARRDYERFFAHAIVRERVRAALASVDLSPRG